jgi:hypothetical protein
LYSRHPSLKGRPYSPHAHVITGKGILYPSGLVSSESRYSIHCIITNQGSSSSPAGLNMFLGEALSSVIALCTEASFLPLSLPIKLGIFSLGMSH